MIGAPPIAAGINVTVTDTHTSSTSLPQEKAIATSILTPTVSQDVVEIGSRATSHGSTVMTETLSVIDEHITDLRQPSVSSEAGDARAVNDSGSEYSNQEHRLSYVAGSDDEGESNGQLSEKDVASWSPARVAEYLLNAGVEKSHCDVFQEQEFSGEVLLGMDQSSIFLKELELGPIGRRLKTWQKIKTLQEEVKHASTTPRSSGTLRDSVTSAGATTGTKSPAVHQDSITVRGEPSKPDTPSSFQHPGSPPGAISASSRAHPSRPSAASIRSLGHSRRQSSVDGTPSMPPSAAAAFVNLQGHAKQGSFDRTWTMGSALGRTPNATRPASTYMGSRPGSAHLYSLSGDRGQFEKRNSQAMFEQDRAAAGGEIDMRRHRHLAKGSSVDHQQQPTYSSSGPVSDAFRRSRPTSAAENAPTAQFGLHNNVMQAGSRVFSEPTMDGTSPIVTKLEYETATNRKRTSAATGEATPDRSSVAGSAAGTRAVSDAVTGREKAMFTLPVDPVPKPLPSPSLGGSSTPSIDSKGYSFDGSQNKPVTVLPGPGAGVPAARRKNKKETSAYTRGLERKSPQEQRIGCEYSGWMKKRSSNLLTAWKPRLFILKGRRLSYYYSESDTEEKGLIDISNHRVLPADNERLTGLHASLTGGSTPTSPQMMSSSFSPRTSWSNTSPVSPFPNGSSLSPKESGSNTFIFKLVPPRTGLSKAVQFTKPTVHYFAVPNVDEGRRWMAALIKATIDKDDSKGVTTTYQHKTISLEKARARKERPPALMHVEEEDTVPGAQILAAFSPEGSIHDNDSRSLDEARLSGGPHSAPFQVPPSATSSFSPVSAQTGFGGLSRGDSDYSNGTFHNRADSDQPVSPISRASTSYYGEQRNGVESENLNHRVVQGVPSGGYSPRASSIQRSSAGGSTYGLGIEGLNNGSPTVHNGVQ